MKATEQNRGNAMPLILAILLLLGIGVAGWMYFSKQEQQNAGMSTVDEALTEEVANEDQPIAPATPTEETSETSETVTSTEETAVASAPSSYDLAKASGVRAIGSADAPIKIIEFASMTCSHCAHFHNDVLPELKSKYVDTGKVYVEFKEFPLDDAALKATITARCLPEDKYEGFIALLFKTQDHWARGINYMTALRQNAKLAGMSDATFDACHADEKLKLAIADWMQQAQEKWSINSTPTFVVNDGAEKISGAQPVAEFERVFRKISGDAIGEAPKVE